MIGSLLIALSASAAANGPAACCFYVVSQGDCTLDPSPCTCAPLFELGVDAACPGAVTDAAEYCAASAANCATCGGLFCGMPTPLPTASPLPTAGPTRAPTASPTASPSRAPTAAPSAAPTSAPTAAPSPAPSAAPSAAPTSAPTAAPSPRPSPAPTPPPTPLPTYPPTPPPSPPPSPSPTPSPTVSLAPTRAPPLLAVALEAVAAFARTRRGAATIAGASLAVVAAVVVACRRRGRCRRAPPPRRTDSRVELADVFGRERGSSEIGAASSANPLSQRHARGEDASDGGAPGGARLRIEVELLPTDGTPGVRLPFACGADEPVRALKARVVREFGLPTDPARLAADVLGRPVGDALAARDAGLRDGAVLRLRACAAAEKTSNPLLRKKEAYSRFSVRMPSRGRG